MIKFNFTQINEFIFNKQFWNQSKFKVKFITFLYHHCTNSHIECQCSLNPNQNSLTARKTTMSKSLLIDQVLLMMTRSREIENRDIWDNDNKMVM